MSNSNSQMNSPGPQSQQQHQQSNGNFNMYDQMGGPPSNHSMRQGQPPLPLPSQQHNLQTQDDFLSGFDANFVNQMGVGMSNQQQPPQMQRHSMPPNFQNPHANLMSPQNPQSIMSPHGNPSPGPNMMHGGPPNGQPMFNQGPPPQAPGGMMSPHPHGMISPHPQQQQPGPHPPGMMHPYPPPQSRMSPHPQSMMSPHPQQIGPNGQPMPPARMLSRDGSQPPPMSPHPQGGMISPHPQPGPPGGVYPPPQSRMSPHPGQMGPNGGPPIMPPGMGMPPHGHPNSRVNSPGMGGPLPPPGMGMGMPPHGHHIMTPGGPNGPRMMHPHMMPHNQQFGGPPPPPGHPGHMMGPPMQPPNGPKIYPPNQPMIYNMNNPNAPPIHPCGVCHREVQGDSEDGLLCESGCNFWYHRTCIQMSPDAYSFLKQEIYAEWACDNCLRTKNVPPIKLRS